MLFRSVGYHLARYLVEAGASVYGADVHRANVERAVMELGISAVTPAEVLSLPVDILAPCAMGGVLNDTNIAAIKAGIVAGAANNQLAAPHHAIELAERGVLYCPDFVINAGGIIDVHCQRSGATAEVLRARIDGIRNHLSEIFRRSEREAIDTHSIAEQLAANVLQQARLPRAS